MFETVFRPFQRMLQGVLLINSIQVNSTLKSPSQNEFYMKAELKFLICFIFVITNHVCLSPEVCILFYYRPFSNKTRASLGEPIAAWRTATQIIMVFYFMLFSVQQFDRLK